MKQNKVSDIRQEFLNLKHNEEYIIDKTGVKTLEIINANFIADEDTIFGQVNQNYIEREIQWYKSMSLNVNDIPGNTPTIWKQVADENGYINSNYGWCIWAAENKNQYNNVLQELQKNIFSRRAIMIYTRPNMWYDYNLNGRSDFMCTNTVQYVVRNNKLHCIVQMRSNDAWAGYRNDRSWQLYVLNMLASDLNIEAGNIYWNCGSLHFYAKQFDLIQ
jgi:thymidylate synthase